MNMQTHYSRQHKTLWRVQHLATGAYRLFATLEDARAYAMECSGPTNIRAPIYHD